MGVGTRPGIGVYTTLELVARARDKFGGRVFAQRRLPSGEFSRVTYDELYDDVVGLGAALGKIGVLAGTPVGVVGENRYEWAVAYLAATGGGAVCVPLDPQLKEKELAGILDKDNVFLYDAFYPLKQPSSFELEPLSEEILCQVHTPEMVNDIKRSGVYLGALYSAAGTVAAATPLCSPDMVTTTLVAVSTVEDAISMALPWPYMS